MATVATIGQLAAGLGLLLGNGYFVTVEFAMTRVRQFEERSSKAPGGSNRPER
jgi:CBS domain containing-hemolysin-like protein